MEGFLEPPGGDKAFGNLFDRCGFAAGESLRGDVAVDVAARIGDVFQGDRPVSMLFGRPMVEPLAGHVFELIEAGGAESSRECDDHLAARAVCVGREQVEDLGGQHLRIALGDGGPGAPAVANGFGDGVTDHAVRVIGPLEDVRVEPDQTPEQLGSGARADGEKLRGDPLPDPVELVGEGAAFAVAIESLIHADGVDLTCQGLDERITRS